MPLPVSKYPCNWFDLSYKIPHYGWGILKTCFFQSFWFTEGFIAWLFLSVHFLRNSMLDVFLQNPHITYFLNSHRIEDAFMKSCSFTCNQEAYLSAEFRSNWTKDKTHKC
jgi:hypothetical protein